MVGISRVKDQGSTLKITTLSCEATRLLEGIYKSSLGASNVQPMLGLPSTTILVPDSSIRAAFEEGVAEREMPFEDQPSHADVAATQAFISKIVEEVNVFARLSFILA